MALYYVHLAVFTLVHLAGLVVAIVLLLKVKGTPAILATVAFGLSFIRDIGEIARVAFLNDLVREVAGRNVQWGVGGLGCCCGVFELIAIVCLIVAIWQAVSATAVEGVAEEEVVGTIVEEAENIE